MSTPDFTISILVDQTPQQVFDAATDPRAWWSMEIEGSTNRLNDVFLYHYKNVHLCKLKVVELVPGQKAVWLVLENYFDFIEDKSEWIGTKIIFQVSEQGGKTQLTFTHQGLVPQYECYKICFDAWTNYIKNSLYQLITTGKGHPNEKEDGFNSALLKKWQLQE
jgi:hypothetical protein